MENTIKKYKALNELYGNGGIVIFGGSEDMNIPLCELKQAFAINEKLCCRSFEALSVKNAAQLYDEYIAQLHPSTVLLHIGSADLYHFRESPADFDNDYRRLISHIRESGGKCDIAVISLKNPDKNDDIAALNRHLGIIAESERCEYGDISINRVWNPSEMKDIISFVYSTGFVHPLKNKRPIFDLVKILFCYTA